MLFEKERFNISKVSNVLYYAPKSLRHKYHGNLAFYELTYYIKGDSIVTFNGKKIHMNAGDILYLPKGVEDDNYTVCASQEFALYNIYFDTDEEMPREPIRITPKNEDFKGMYERIFHTWADKKEGYYYKVMQQAYEIFGLVRRVQLGYAPKGRFHRLVPSEEYMASHFDEVNFNFKACVELSGLSYSYFKKLFVEKHGCPPVKYVTKLKIKRACELLQTGKFGISEIASMCGFENVYYFSNVFKKQVGVSPTNYKLF